MNDPAEYAVIQKVIRRLIPFLMLCFLLNFLDRSNISVAKLSLIGQVPGFNDGVFSTGLALFYLPYCFLELPSNLIQVRVGARRWIARIMISWGITSACFVFIVNPYIGGPQSFYWLRGLLGVFEAGFFPGVMLYLSLWIPHEHRARAKALFFLSTAFAAIISNVLGGFILYFAGKYTLWLAPWQWLFLLEGVPSVIMGFVVLKYLTDKPADAQWLSDEERERLVGIMAREERANPGHSAAQFKDALLSPLTWVLALIYSAMNWAYNPVQFYTQDTIKKALAAAGSIVPAPAAKTAEEVAANLANPAYTPGYLIDLYVALLSAIPFGLAAVTMLYIARHSDRMGKRKPHIMVCCLIMCAGLVLAGSANWMPGNWKAVGLLAGLSMSAIGWFGAFATFWAIPATLMTGTAVAAAMAIVNAVGNLMGNYFGNILRTSFRVVEKVNGKDVVKLDYALFVAAGMAFVGFAATALLKMPRTGDTGKSPAH